MNEEPIRSTLAQNTVWPIDRVKDHALKIGSGLTPSGGSASYLEAGVPLLRSQNVHFDGLRLDDVAFIAEETHDQMAGTKLSPCDVLLNITGASIGRCTYVPDDFGEGNVNQHVSIIRSFGRLHFKYLTYCLSAPWGQDQISSAFTGASREGLSRRNLGELQVPLPPIPEQKRISAYLDASCASIDRAVETKQKQLEILDALRKSIIQRAVSQGLNPKVKMKDSDVEWLGPVPTHWKVQKLKRVFSKIDYGISQSTEQEGTYAVLKMGNIVKGEIAFTKIEFVLDVAPDLILEKGDLLFNRTNSLDQVAKVGIFRGDQSDNVTCASYLVRLRANHKNHSSYLNHLVNAEIFLGLARKMAIPSVQQANLNPTRYCRLEIPVPPLPEQIEIASYLDQKSEQVREIEQRLNDQISTLSAYRKSLIHECVTGKRRISNEDVAKVVAHV